jgi:hypothetical protein
VLAQLTLAKASVPITPGGTLTSDVHVQDADALVAVANVPWPFASTPTASHSLVEGQLTPVMPPLPAASGDSVVAGVHVHVAPVRTPEAAIAAEFASEPTATHTVALGQLTEESPPAPDASGVTTLAAVQAQLPPWTVPSVVIP